MHTPKYHLKVHLPKRRRVHHATHPCGNEELLISKTLFRGRYLDTATQVASAGDTKEASRLQRSFTPDGNNSSRQKKGNSRWGHISQGYQRKLSVAVYRARGRSHFSCFRLLVLNTPTPKAYCDTCKVQVGIQVKELAITCMEVMK